MTDRKPKGSTPVAPQRPNSSQSTATSNGASQGDKPTQAMPRVNNDKPSAGQKQQGAATGKATQNSAPATKQRPSAAPPKTAGEIAAESAPNQQQRPGPTPAKQPSTPQSAPAPVADAAASRTARLRLARVDPWSVMKVSFALSIALAIVTVIAISIVWFVLGAAGVWDAVNSSVASLLSDDAESFDITEYVGYGRVIGFALLVSAVDVVLITAIATLGAFLYNLAASLLGGLELTLAEDS